MQRKGNVKSLQKSGAGEGQRTHFVACVPSGQRGPDGGFATAGATARPCLDVPGRSGGRGRWPGPARGCRGRWGPQYLAPALPVPGHRRTAVSCRVAPCRHQRLGRGGTSARGGGGGDAAMPPPPFRPAPQPPPAAEASVPPARACPRCVLFRAQDPRPRGGGGGQDGAATGPSPGAAVRPGRARRAPGTGAQAGERLGQRPAGRAVPIRGLPARPRLSHCEWSFCFSELSFTYRPRELGTGVLLLAAPSPPSPVSVQPAPAGNLPTETYFCLKVLNDNDKQRRLAQELFV